MQGKPIDTPFQTAEMVIDGITYTVESYSRSDATMTIKDKLKRLILKDAESLQLPTSDTDTKEL